MTGSPSDDDTWLTTGRFAALTLLSVKALRVYDDRGLLRPQQVDPHNGYRYYSREQVGTGWLIGLLRGADLSLTDIDQIIGATDRAAGLQHLETCAAVLSRRSEATQAVLARARLHLTQEAFVSHVQPALMMDRPLLSVLRRMRPEQMDTVIADVVGRLRKTAATNALTPTGDPFGIFHAPITDDSNGPLEIALPVDGLADAAGEIRSYRLPGGLVASRYAEGPETGFPQVLTLYDDVHTWITRSGRVPVGPPRETWHTAPGDPERTRLTISWPYATDPGNLNPDGPAPSESDPVEPDLNEPDPHDRRGSASV